MINTYNESELHKTLKLYYAELYGGQTEIQFHKWICDIQTPSGTIIEIQTSNLAALKEKALAAIKEKRDLFLLSFVHLSQDADRMFIGLSSGPATFQRFLPVSHRKPWEYGHNSKDRSVPVRHHIIVYSKSRLYMDYQGLNL